VEGATNGRAPREWKPPKKQPHTRGAATVVRVPARVRRRGRRVRGPRSRERRDRRGGIAPGLAVAHTVVPESASAASPTPTARATSSGRGDADLENARAILEPPRSTGRIGRGTRDGRPMSGVSTETAERELGQIWSTEAFGGSRGSRPPPARRVFGRDARGRRGRRRARALGATGPVTPTASGSPSARSAGSRPSVRDFRTRAPTDKPFFQPGSMDPLLARAVANVAGARPGATIWIRCGTGGVLVESSART